MRKNRSMKNCHSNEEKFSNTKNNMMVDSVRQKSKIDPQVVQLYPSLPNPQKLYKQPNRNQSGSGIFSSYHTVKQISKTSSIKSKQKRQCGTSKEQLKSNKLQCQENKQDNQRENYDLDDDDKDFFSLLTEIDKLNFSQIVPNKEMLLKNPNTNGKTTNKKNEDQSQTQQLDFLKFVKQLNRQQKQEELNKLFAKLSQQEVKSLILESYIHKILEDPELVSLQDIHEKFTNNYRIPAEEKRIFLLFLQEIVEQVDLEAEKFSPKKYKFKIEENIKQAIQFSRKIQNHLTVNKRKILQKLINAYMNVDYVHIEGKKILCRNMAKIIKFHKQYKDQIKLIANKNASKNQNQKERQGKNNLVRTNSLITQSQNYDQPINERENKVLTRSQARKQYEKNQLISQTERDDYWEIKSTGFKSEDNYPVYSQRAYDKKQKNIIPYQLSKYNKTQIDNVKELYGKQQLAQKQKSKSKQKHKKDYEEIIQPKPFIKKRVIQLQIKSQFTQIIQVKKNVKQQQNKAIDKNRNEIANCLQKSYIQDNLQSQQQQKEQTKQDSKNQNQDQPIQACIQNKNRNVINPNNHSLSLSLTMINSTNNSQNLNNKNGKNSHINGSDMANQKKETKKAIQNYQSNKIKQDIEDSQDLSSDGSSQQGINAQLLNITKIIDARLLKKQLQIKQESQQDQSEWKSQDESQQITKAQIKEQQKSLQPSLRYEQFTPKEQKVRTFHKQEPQLSTNSTDKKINPNSSIKQQEQLKQLGVYIQSKLNQPFIEQLQNNMVKYYGSKPEFHVQPRRAMLDFVLGICKQVTKVRNTKAINANCDAKRDKIVQLGRCTYAYFETQKITNFQQVYNKYYKGYFRVDEKRQMFADVKEIIRYYNKSL